MNKRLLSLLIVALLAITSVPSFAAHNDLRDSQAESYVVSDQTAASPVILKKDITVTSKGGEFQVGYATLKFKKDFISSDELPVTYTVTLYAVNGQAGVDISPSTGSFDKPVILKTEGYKGLIYDTSSGQNINVNIKKQTLVLTHFSWHRWR